jgi:Ca2+-binding EF-hand superfamily protein
MSHILSKPPCVVLFALPLFALAFAAAPEEKPGPKEKEKEKEKGKADKDVSPEAVKLIRVHVREYLKEHDTDKDGKLSRKEFYSRFDRFDRNSDDSLDRKELVEAVKASTEAKEVKPDQAVITFLREHDVNKDGKLTREEAKVLFDGADADKDGLLDEDELVKAVIRLVPPPADDTPSELPRVAPSETPKPRPRARRLGRLLGLRVIVQGGDPLGKVIDVVVSEDGYIAYVIVQDQADLVAVPWGVVVFGADQALTVNVRVTAEKLKEVTFARARFPDFASERWLRSVRTVWGEQALRRPGADQPKTGDGPPDTKPPVKDKDKPAKDKDKPPIKDKDRPTKDKDKPPIKDKDKPAKDKDRPPVKDKDKPAKQP